MMSKYHPWTAVGGLIGVFALVTAVPPVSAQDTSSAGQAGRDTSATAGYSGMARDTTGQGNAQPTQPVDSGRLGDSAGLRDTSAAGQQGVMIDTSRSQIVGDTSTTAQHRAQVWYAPKDTAGALAGDTAQAAKGHKHKRRLSRMHPADTAAVAEPGAAKTPNGTQDTSGMQGRRSADSTLPAETRSPTEQSPLDSTSDSGHVSGP
jgi:hypothetical protein